MIHGAQFYDISARFDDFYGTLQIDTATKLGNENFYVELDGNERILNFWNS